MFNPNTIKNQHPIVIAPLAMLECIGQQHKDDLYALIQRNRDYFQTFIPWIHAGTTEGDVEDFISACVENAKQGVSFAYIIRIRGLFTGFMEVRWNDTQNHQFPDARYAHLHYFIGKRFQGFGIMTHTIMAVTSDLFTTYGIKRIGIACPAPNEAGLRAADHAGYTFEKTITGAQTLVGGNVIDHQLYSQTVPNYQHDQNAG